MSPHTTNVANVYYKAKRTGIKLDSTALEAKCNLRMWLLGRMGIEEAYVLDTCAGQGTIWEAMEDLIPVRQWTRCDIKPRRTGTIRLDATDAIENFPIDTYNVVDIDPYGEPWEPFRALLPKITRPTAVFLTHCYLHLGNASYAVIDGAELPPEWIETLPYDGYLVAYIVENFLLAQTHDHVDVAFAAQMSGVLDVSRKGGSAKVTYYALGLVPRG